MVVLLIFVVVLFFALIYRRRCGFGGETVSRDDLELKSERLGLIGRPDRIERVGKYLIPVDKKTGNSVYPNHRAQMGAYFLIIEDVTGVRPPYGYIVLSKGQRMRIMNTKELRAWVLSIRKKRIKLKQMPPAPPANATVNKCRRCGYRARCAFVLR